MYQILLFTYLLLMTACSNYSKGTEVVKDPMPAKTQPRNLILLIGDGMGLTQISAGLYMNNNRLHLEEFPVIGLHKPYAAGKLITDSAAGATAFACGVKTYNGAIGVDADTMPVPTILEEAESRGMATGLVATSTITHATPASFIAHVPSRRMMEEIAAHFLETELEYFVGGGLKYFNRRKSDDRNLVQELEQRGYRISNYVMEDFDKMAIDYSKRLAYFTADADPLPAAQGRDYLLPATKLGPLFLKKASPEGFFLMVEGSQIDWGGHANNSDYIISEMIDFDRAIGAALEFARNDGETLVVVTADHETGGYALNPGSKMGAVEGAFTSDYHTATLVPVFAYGPGADLFGGIYENTDIYHKMRRALGLEKELQ